MTDITELAQSLKRRAASANEFGEGLFFIKADDVIALVEALEKAQAKADVYDMLRDDYGLREKGVGLADFVDWQAKRIAEMESLTVTVKLPDIMPPEAAPAHYWGSSESMAYADGYNKSAADLKTSFALSCSSAGVNVEFE